MVRGQKSKNKGTAAGAKRARKDVYSCGDCRKELDTDAKALQCEKCMADDTWKCIECLGISEDTYENLMSTGSRLRWFCDGCDQKVLSSGSGDLNTEHHMGEIKAMFESLLERTKKFEDTLKEKADVKVVEDLQKRVDKLEEEMKHKEAKEGSEIVSKDELEKTVEKVISRQHSDDKDLENRRKNVIVYRAPEDVADSKEARRDKDRQFLQAVCRESLGVELAEGDVVKMFRLGKKLEAGKPRPLLVGFRTEDKKSEVMRNLKRLKDARAEHRCISVSHDLSPFQREAVKRALDDAKQQGAGSSLSSENIRYKVVGLGSKIRVVRKEH